MRLPIVMTAGGALLLLAACGQPAEGATAPDAFTARATQMAQVWDESDPDWPADLVLLDTLVRVPDDEGLTDVQQAAFHNGWYELDAELPGGSPDPTASYDGGESTMDVIGSDAAYQMIATGDVPADCPSPGSTDDGGDTDSATAPCGIATVTGVAASTTTRWTNHGLAQYPAWEFTVDGVSDPVTVAAVSADTGQPPAAALPEEAPEDIHAAVHLTEVTDDTISFGFSTGDCVENVRPLVHETDTVVVVGGAADPDGTEICNEMAVLRTVSADLEAPIGDRMILDVVSGSVLTRGGLMEP